MSGGLGLTCNVPRPIFPLRAPRVFSAALRQDRFQDQSQAHSRRSPHERHA